MSDAGKGDDCRIRNKKKFNENYDRIFGKKDFMDFHKDKTKKKDKDIKRG